MQANSLRALITCEVTTEFLASLNERNIKFELSGWGQNGITLSERELVAKAQNCEIVIVEIEELNRKVLESLPNLKFVGVSRGTPVNVDLGFCEQQKIPVVHTPGRNADSVADYCLAMMLDLSRKLTSSSRHLSNEGWLFDGKLPYLEFRGREIGNLVVGLYGFGQIGVRVASALSMGLGPRFTSLTLLLRVVVMQQKLILWMNFLKLVTSFRYTHQSWMEPKTL